MACARSPRPATTANVLRPTRTRQGLVGAVGDVFAIIIGDPCDIRPRAGAEASDAVVALA